MNIPSASDDKTIPIIPRINPTKGMKMDNIHSVSDAIDLLFVSPILFHYK
ncbi:hypothetical protein [Viridibacillus arvi]|nr:hypothetical protein [Viridibacillus sp. JNUCC-6]QOV12043.1 hypothetical protein JNUCC6_04525 [Viridibacillus sp. JNUCC-6]